MLVPQNEVQTLEWECACFLVLVATHHTLGYNSARRIGLS